MENYLNPSNITFGLGILGIIFSVFNYFRNPQIKSDKTDALMAQQMKYLQESNDRRFSEMQRTITEAMALANNHVHTVDTKVEALNLTVSQLGKDVVRLGTIIEERIPKKP